MTDKTVCVSGRVRGKVQGVWFRRFVQEYAEARGVTGHAENLSDGSVEVLLCGEAEAVAEVQAQVASGPPAAEVAEVQWQQQQYQSATGFSVR